MSISRIEGLPRSLRLAIAGAAALFVLPLAFLAASGVWRVIGWRTVATERKSYARGAFAFGYTLQRPLWNRDDFLLTLSGHGFSIQLQSSGTILNRLLERRWLCDNRVVYLSMDTKNDYGSYSIDQTIKVIFDFERSALYTFNSPWRVGSPDNGRKREVSEAEFNGLLQWFEGECHPAPVR